jgi:hypothetical protein
VKSTSFRKLGSIAATATLLVSASALGQIVKINEIDYDQPATDTAEFVELAGPPGMDVSAWQLVLYNGATPATSVTYRTITFPAGTAIPASGFLVVGAATVPNVNITCMSGATNGCTVATDIIQNGSPDGLCLVNNSGAVVDIWAYETSLGPGGASMVASNGPAVGMTFPDVGAGISENSVAPNLSMQRIPDGGSTWQVCVPTPGAANNCNAPTATAGLTLTQVATPVDCMLQGSGPGSLVFRIQSLPANGTLSQSGNPITTVPFTLSSNTVTYTGNAGFSGVDSFTFDTTNGAGSSAIVTQEVGVQQNTVVITEIMESPNGGDDIFEYVEIFNNGATPVTLDTLDVSTSTTVSTAGNLAGAVIPGGEYRIIAPTTTAIPGDQFRCNWQLPADHIIYVPNMTGNDKWENLTSTSRVLLFGTGNTLLDAVDVRVSGFVIPPTGQSLDIDTFFLPAPPNHVINTATNDNGIVWNAANAIFDPSNVRTAGNGDRGDPGFVPPDDDGANTGPFTPQPACVGACCSGGPTYSTCSLVSASDCATLGGVYRGDGSVCVSANCGCTTAAAARPPTTPDGTGIILCNLVITSTTDLISSASFKSIAAQDSTGGVTIFGSNADIDALVAASGGEGHQIDFAGSTSTFNGLLEIAAPFTFLSDDGSVGVPAPTPTTPADWQDASPTAEGLESLLVSLPCVTFQQTGTFTGATNYTVSNDGGNTVVSVRVATGQLDLVGQPIPTDPVTLTGIFSQFSTSMPADNGYQLLPRSMADIQACVAQVAITSANPPAAADNPYEPGQPYTDLLDTGSGATVTAGIGAAGTAPQGGIQYAPIRVTFSGAPSPAPSSGNITVACTGGTCPSVTSVTAVNATTFDIDLSGGIPPLHCTTLTFAGGQTLQYRSHPGNLNLDMATNTQDLLALVQALNNGSANMAANFARYNVNRSTESPPVNTQDLLRLVQLLNGTNTTQVFAGATAAACPP